MFPRLTEAIVKNQSADLISNQDVNRKWELLTLVKIRKNNLFSPFNRRKKYTPLALKLSRIVGEDLSLKPQTEILVKDFQISRCFGGGVEVGGGTEEVQVEVSGEMKNVDTSSTVTLMSEHFSFRDLEELTFKSINLEQKVLSVLQLKEGEKLAFVTQRVYNTEPVDVFRETSMSGSTGAKFLGLFTVGVKGEKSDESKFTVPENKTFAFALKQMIIEDGVLGFSSEYACRGQEEIMDSEIVRMLIEGFQRKQKVLQQLAGRRYLLKDLIEIVEDREALTLLEDTLDQIRYGEYQRPRNDAVVWFMALLDVSSASKDLTDAVHLLVGALEALPNNIPASLAKSDVETLNSIILQVGRLLCGQARHPLPPLRPLQEDGELHWVGKLLSSARDLRDLEENRDHLGVSPEALLELLYISARGLSLMRSAVHSE